LAYSHFYLKLSITSKKEKHENKPVAVRPNEITTVFEDYTKFFLLYANPQILDLIVCNAHFEHNKLQMAGVVNDISAASSNTRAESSRPDSAEDSFKRSLTNG
jgi:hypothetical protein